MQKSLLGYAPMQTSVVRSPLVSVTETASKRAVITARLNYATVRFNAPMEHVKLCFDSDSHIVMAMAFPVVLLYCYAHRTLMWRVIILADARRRTMP